MSEHEFKLETTFSGSSGTFLRPVAAVVAIAGIVGILFTMTTGLASWLLPMRDRYLYAVVPRGPDGSEALALQSLDQESTPASLTVTGTVFNRTEFGISDLHAVIDVQGRFGLVMKTVSVPLEPAILPAGESLEFQTTIPLEEMLTGYTLKFQLGDGPFVPHRDEREGIAGIEAAESQ